MSTDLLTEEDFWDDIHGYHEVGDGLSIEDSQLSMNVPIVISYELADMDKTNYHFKQEFKWEDTKAYFQTMKDISCRSVNDIINESDHTLHFHRTRVNGKIKSLLKRLNPECEPDESTIIYHFALYTGSRKASRASGNRSPRVYFMLGRNGMIFPLFFDPYHEINP